MNEYNQKETECISPAKDFEAIVFNLRELTQLQELRLNGIQKLRDKLIGQSNVTGEAVPMPKSNVSSDSLQGQLQESLVILNRIGNETDKILEILHDKI